jgi:hypothetical protein
MGSNNASSNRKSVTTPVSLTGFTSGLTTATQEYRRALDAGERALVVCARFTWEAFANGMIGADAPEGGFKSQRDYAARFVSSKGAPVGQTTVVLWRRWGRAESLGVEEPTLGRIVQCFGDSRVGEVLDNGSKTAIVKAVKAIYGKDGKRIPAPKPNAQAPASESGAAQVPTTRNDSTTLDALETMLARLSNKPTPATVKRMEALAENLAARIASAKAPKATTPKATARKATASKATASKQSA